MNITTGLVLIVGVVAVLLLIVWRTNDLRLCLAEKKLLVILVLNSEVCRAAHSEPVMDGHPSPIQHPP